MKNHRIFLVSITLFLTFSLVLAVDIYSQEKPNKVEEKKASFQGGVISGVMGGILQGDIDGDEVVGRRHEHHTQRGHQYKCEELTRELFEFMYVVDGSQNHQSGDS